MADKGVLVHQLAVSCTAELAADAAVRSQQARHLPWGIHASQGLQAAVDLRVIALYL